jgi:hypothetical protein
VASEDLRERVDAARAQLMRIPGVVGVGYGYKQRSGVTTTEVALRVYVREKKPAEDLAPEELVLEEVCGLRTDVLTVISTESFTCESLDEHSPLVGGIHILHLETPGAVGIGTLGFFATKNGDSSRDKYVLLTNHHVFADPGVGVGTRVYQPGLRRQGGVLELVNPNDPRSVGSIDNMGMEGQLDYAYPGESRHSYFVDCATAKISTCYSSWCDTNCGTSLENRIVGLDIGGSSAIAGVGRVRPEDIPEGGPPYQVVKVGHTTGRTVGKVVGVDETIQDRATNVMKHGCIIVENTGPNCENGAVFAEHGDSGSVLVNRERMIVALLFGGDTDIGTGHASHIAPVLHHLRITMISRSNRIVGDATTASRGTPVMVTPDASVGRAGELRARILESERGIRTRELVDRHRDEVVHLVNRVRQVTVAWHRVHGPEFLAHVVEASRRSTHRVPAQIEGVSRAEAAAHMLESFSRFGSAALREGVRLHGDDMRALLDAANHIEELADAIERSPDAPLHVRAL